MATTTLVSEVDEQTWWKEHPEPGVTRTDDRLVLWNYPVGKSDLSDVHADAVRNFLQSLAISLGRGSTASSRSTVSITGHASRTGEASMNDGLARDRAEAVAVYLRGRRALSRSWPARSF
jgi:outer membrane protein OmpA-like peptidoglycan-associated protein